MATIAKINRTRKRHRIALGSGRSTYTTKESVQGPIHVDETPVQEEESLLEVPKLRGLKVIDKIELPVPKLTPKHKEQQSEPVKKLVIPEPLPVPEDPMDIPGTPEWKRHQESKAAAEAARTSFRNQPADLAKGYEKMKKLNEKERGYRW